MPIWLHQFLQQCIITADEATTRSRRAFAARRSSARSSQSLQISDLEPRVLFSATPIDPASLPGGDEAAMVVEVEPAQQDDANSVSKIAAAQATSEIVIIDGAVDSLDQLLDDLSQSRPGAEVFLLDSARDGIDQITEILDGRSDIDSLHIISHGSEGTVGLGNTWLTENNLDSYAGQIASWQSAFSSDGDILFYGCDLAASESGRELVESISVLTGADVAASDDLTGHASLGADWNLEHTYGSIETEIVFSADLQDNWRHVLPPLRAKTTAGTLNYTEGAGSVFIDTGFTVTGNNPLIGASVTIVGGFNSGEDSLAYNAALLGSVGVSTTANSITFSGGESLAHYEALLRSVSYANGSIDPSTALRTIEFMVDEGGNTDVDTRDINVIPVNSDPTVDSNNPLGVAEDGAGVITGTMLQVSDLDHLVSELTYTITSATSDGTVFRNGTPLGVGGTFTQADVDGGFVTYTNSGENATDTFTFVVSDTNGGVSPATVFTINVALSNDDPIFTTTATPSILENNSTVLNVNASDADLPSETIQYFITGGVDAGLFSVDINSGLLSFAVAPDFESPSDAGANNVYNLTMEARDGVGGVAVQNLTITVTDANDPPLNAVPGTQSTLPDTPLTFSAANGNLISVSDSDAGVANLEATLSVINGTVTLDLPFNPATAAGPEFSLAKSDTGVQRETQVASLPDGRFVVVWSGAGTGDSDGIFMRRFNADGTPSDINDTRLNSNPAKSDPQYQPTVAVNDAGRIVVAWTSFDQDATSSEGIYYRSMNWDGTSDTGEIRANNNVSGHQNDPAVAMDSLGNVTVVWTHENGLDGQTEGIFARRFDAGGTPIDPDDWQVNTYWFNKQQNAQIAMDSGGNFVIAWESQNQELLGTQFGIYAKRFDANANELDAPGTPGVAEFQVNVTEFKNQHAPSVAMDETGNFVVVWASQDQDGDDDGVFGQLFDSAGNKIGTTEFQVSTSVTWDQTTPSVAMDDNGNFVVAWEHDTSEFGPKDIRFQQFDNNAAKVGSEQTANNPTAGEQNAPDVAMDASGNFVIVWDGQSPADGDGGAIARQYDVPPPPLAFFAGDGTADSFIRFRGNLADVNAALDGLLFTPDSGFTGLASINIDINDLGNSGPGGPLSDNDTVDINVTLLNAPLILITDSDTLTADSVAENASLGTYVGITALAIDPNVGDAVSYTLTDSAGGRFDIDLNAGTVTLVGAIDYETATSHDITVRADSTDGSFVTKDFTINILDIDEFDVSSVTDTDGTPNSVSEGAAIGATVGITAFADDNDGSDVVNYSLDDDAGGRFTIHATSGVMTVNAALDAETLTSHNIIVRATSSDTSTNTQGFTINVTDVNEFDVSSISDADGSANTVAEDAIVGTPVGITAFADDPDVDDMVNYTLDDDAGGRFTINASTGEITVNGALDAETAGSHNITVRATSTDTSFKTQAFAIAVTDVDDFDIGTISDNDLAANSVAENSSIGTTVGITAFADDLDVSDNVSYSLDDDAGGLFAINTTSGVVTVNGSLDAESSTSHNITVRATSDDASFSTQDFTITVADVSEFDIGVISDTDAAVEIVAENAAIGAAVGMTALASDPDIGDTVSYTLDDDAGGRFTIHATTGVVTVNAPLNAEAATSHNIIVRATSTDASFDTQGFTITVTDVDEFDVGAISDSDGVADEVLEDAANGTAVGITAFADDSDIGDDVTYTLDDDAGGRFAIDATSGVITVADTNLIDFETTTTHNVTVRATSDDASSSTAIFAINILDAPDSGAGPISDTDSSADSVAENATVGATVGITAFSDDIDPLDLITYTLDDDAGGLFTIHGTTGVVTVNAALDAETATSHNITVRATSDDTSFVTQAFTITVSDINETAISAMTDSDAAADSVSENAIIGTNVGITALANDPDVNDNVSYSLDVDAGGLFAIDATTGVVTVIGTLDAETTASHLITVRATSDDTSTVTQNYNITVTDFDEYNVGPITDTDAAADSVAENATGGTAVGITASANDDDLSDNVTYTLDNDAGGRFEVDGTTGVITVNGPLDFETSTSHNIVVRATSDDGSISIQGFTIAVTDVNESSIGSITDSNGSPDTVAEGSPIGTNAGITALATDPDAGDEVTYSLDDSAGGLFAIDATTGVVTVNGSLNAETSTSHNIVVRATSDDLSFATLGFTINVSDVDEFNTGAIADTDATTNRVSETVAIGANVGITARASDPDVSDSVNYSLDDDAGGRFTINTVTGVVIVNAALDYELSTSHSITVRATSTDTSFSTRVLSIAVDDVNDTAPVITPAQVFTVAENVANGTLVATAIASDADTIGSLQNWMITGGNADGIFAINSLTGELTVVNNTNLDFETSSSYVLSLQVDDGVNSSAIETVTINIGDANDAPTINNQIFSVDENSTNGTSPGTVLAGDVDVAQTLSYAIIGGTGQTAFSINAATGELTVADRTKLNFEAMPVLALTVRVSDNGAPSLSNTATITINVNDINDAPVAIGESYSITRGETVNIPAAGLLANDYDEDGNPLTAILVSGAAGGTVTVNADGSFSYVSDGVFFGNDSFTYKTNDGTVDGNTITVVITVVAGVPPTDPVDPTPDPDPTDDPDPTPPKDPVPTPGPDTDPPPEDEPSDGSADDLVSVIDDDDDGITLFDVVRPQELEVDGIGDLSRPEQNSVKLRESSGQARRQRLDVQMAETDVALMMVPGLMLHQLDVTREELESQILGDLILVGSTSAAASGFAVGFVAWAMRSGFLITGLLAQMPAWRSIDPLLIMQGMGNDEDQETLEEMMERESQSLA